MRLIHTFSLIIVIAVLFLSACSKKYQYSEGMVWNTAYHITYKGDANLQDSVMAVMKEVGSSLSVFDSTSLVSRLNLSPAIESDRHLKAVYECSHKINRITKRAFDPTLSPLITAWGFGKGHRPTSDTLRIDSLLQLVGIEKTFLRNDSIIKEDARINFNFSAVAKGYGVDEVARMFLRNGVEDYLIEIGGEIRVCGESPSGGKWRISIDRPTVKANKEIHDSQAIIAITDLSLATSGNYRNYHEIGGKRLGHTIDRLTGRPAVTTLASATVLADDCMTADALATALMAMPDAGLKNFCIKNNIAAFLVFHSGEVWTSPGFKTLTETL